MSNKRKYQMDLSKIKLVDMNSLPINLSDMVNFPLLFTADQWINDQKDDGTRRFRTEGYGCWVKDNKRSNQNVFLSPQLDATHVLWYESDIIRKDKNSTDLIFIKFNRYWEKKYGDDENELYPVYYNGIEYNKEDCDGIFVSFYGSKEALNYEGGVYLSEGLWIYPDGHSEEF